MYEKLARLLRSSLAYTIGNVANRALFIFSMPVMTRYLAPEEYGTLSLVNTVIAILMTFYGLGLHDYAMRFYYERDSEAERKHLMGAVSSFLVLFAFAASIVLSLFGGAVFPRFIKDISFSPYMLIGIWICFAASFETVPDALFRVRDQALLFIGVQTTKSVLAISLSIVSVVLLHRGAEGPLSASLIVSTAAIFFFVAYLRDKVRLNLSPKTIHEGLKFSLPVLLLLLGRVFLDSTDRLLLQHFLDLSEVAFYSVGTTLGSVLIMIAYSINIAWTPFYYETAKIESEEKAKEVFSYASIYLAAAIVYVALIPVILRQEIISILAPPSYYGVVPIVPLIMLGSTFSALFFIPERAMYQQKKTGYLPFLICAGLFLNVVLNFLLIPRLRMAGAAVATASTSFVMLILCLILSQRLYRVPYQYGRLAKVIATALFCYVLSIPLSHWPFLLSFALKLLILLLYPGLLCFLGFFEPRELERVRQVLSERIFQR
jgi:O-antigen/teichoic acid export membrane protein